MWNTKFKKLRFESLEDRQLLSVGPLLNLSYFLSETENAAIVNSSYSSDSSVESADHFSSLLAGFQTGQTAELPGEPVLLLPPRQHGIIRPVQFVNTVENSAPVQFTTSSSNSGGADSSLNVSISQTGNASIFESHQCLDGNDCSCTLDEKYPLIRVNAEGAACSSSNGVVKIALSGTAVYGSDYSFVDNDSFIPFTVSNTGDFIEISLSGGYDSNSGGSDILAEFYVIPLNNGNPNDGDRTVQFTLEETETECSGGVFLPLYTIGNATAEVEIKDDDDWTITGSGGDSIWERAPYDDLPFGEFEITRSGGPDRTYGITTEFVLSGSATPMSDYHLSWFNANDYETVISIYQDNDDVWKGSVYFPANTTDDTITIYVIPNNDAIPENNETVTITVTNAYANPLYPFNASGSGTFTIKDDDKWKISVETTDDTATERISDVTQDYGEFKLVKTFTGEGAGDQSYGITTGFDMIYDSSDLMSAQYGSDYSLQYQNTSGQWVSLTSSNSFTTGDPPVYRYQFSVTIPAGQTEVKVRLVPTFDWEDEAELFDPFGGGTPKNDEGEYANFEIVSASWSGMGNSWNPLGDNTEDEIEIKDGAFVSVTSDFNNDGTIDNTDYNARHGEVGSLVVRNANDIAHYYAWIDVVSFHEFSLDFQGVGGIEYVYSHNNDDSGYSSQALEILTGDKNSAIGTVTVVGANNSTNISSGSLSLSVGGGSDWTRFSVFSITVDMAFNHDRAANDGSDGINIRTDASNNTEHDAPEFRQNAPGTGESWLIPNGSNNQKTVLYLKDKSVTVYNRFVMSLVIPYTVTLKLKATAIPATITKADGTTVTLTNASIGGCKETTVTFTNGVSTGGKSVAGVAGFIEFEGNSQTSSTVNKEQSKFDWEVTKIIGKTDGTGQTLETDTMTFYTVLDVPNGPWNVADTTTPDPNDVTKTIPKDDKIQPWVDVLEYACLWATNQSTYNDTIAEITQNAYSNFGKTYDGSQTHTTGNNCNLTGILTGSVVDCRDMSAIVQLFSQIVGVSNVQVRVIEGYSTGLGFNYKPIKAIGNSVWNSGTWNFHQVVWYGGNVYSACEMLDQTNPKQAVGMSLTEYKSLLYDSGTWNLLTPFVITTFS